MSPTEVVTKPCRECGAAVNEGQCLKCGAIDPEDGTIRVKVEIEIEIAKLPPPPPSSQEQPPTVKALKRILAQNLQTMLAQEVAGNSNPFIKFKLISSSLTEPPFKE